MLAALPFVHGRVDSLPDGLEALVATGDLQGVERAESGASSERLLGEALAAELSTLRARGVLPKMENIAVLLTGDLQPSAGQDDVRTVWRSLGEICRWVAGVAGNHDTFGGDPTNTNVSASLDRPNLYYLDERMERIGSLRIAGLSGIIGNSCETWVRSEAEYTAAAERLMRDRPDLLLLHDGPNVAGTMFPGWPSVRQVLEAAEPCVVFRGHDAWPTTLATLSNGTQVVNVEGRVVVLTRDESRPSVLIHSPGM